MINGHKHGLAEIPVQFHPGFGEVQNLMEQALRQRNGNVVQAYADLVSALTAFAIINDRNVWDITTHVNLIQPKFVEVIGRDKDGLAASIGLFKSKTQI